MKVFVTGGSGFLGKVVIRRLKESGHQVFALARSGTALATVESLGAIGVKGDLRNIETARASLREIETIVHCAAPVEFWGPWEKFNEGIVESTARLASLADECGVKRFIHISSESVLQDLEPLVDIDEDYPYPQEPNSYYGKSKMLAEKHLLNSDFRMEVVILRPPFIWGSDCSSLALIESKVRSGQFMWINGGTAAFEAVQVENLAHAVVLALSKGKDKGVYFITDGEQSTVREFFLSFMDARQLKVPQFSIAEFIARALAGVLEYIWKGLRISKAPPITRFDLAFVSQPRRYIIQRAIDELGYSPVISRAEGWSQFSGA